jgi:histidine triad (HIT) family protein
VDCAFCRIVEGRAPAHRVWDGPDAVAFLDTRPLFAGHTLVVPRAHTETLGDLDDEVLGPLFARVRSVARAVEGALGAAGSFVACNNRISQSVPHLHVHVVPRKPKDGLRGFFWPRTSYASDDDAAAVAGRLHRWLVAAEG